ncbi:MAG TPA: hypothetical protein VK961_08750 [Chthoniobacter sp.]|nr:hypothetical protein [Chthoniobacter sp.]
MNKVIIIISTLLVLLLLTGGVMAADSYDADTPIASYPNRPELWETVGARAAAILREHKIESMSYGSAGMTISVRASRAAEARRLLAQAIKAEKLQLTLTILQGDRYIIVTPDSILDPKKPQ